jgi:PPOX class probable FMN-dependent enzyme
MGLSSGIARIRTSVPAGFDRRPRREIAAILGGVVALGICMYLARGGAVGAGEEAVFNAINGLPDRLRAPMWVFQILGSLAFVVGVGVASCAIRRYRLAIALFATIPLKLALEWWVLKKLVERERPSFTVPGAVIRDVNTSPLGFPSGHAILAFALAGLLAPYLGRSGRLVVYSLAVLNSLARVYLGAHNPLDVVAGAALGIAVAAGLNLVVGVPRPAGAVPTPSDRNQGRDRNHEGGAHRHRRHGALAMVGSGRDRGAFVKNRPATIATVGDLEAAVGLPTQLNVDKVLDRLDDHMRNLIASSPYLLMATTDGNGHMDVSPRGDPAGWVQVIDDGTIMLPERPGNRRADTLHNLLENQSIGLIFLVPGFGETLRISGRARITQDPTLLEQSAIMNKVPTLGIVVTIEECFIQCARASHRAGLWDPDSWPEVDGLPSMAQMLRDQARSPVPLDALEDRVAAAYTDEGLYAATVASDTPPEGG